MSKYRDKSRDPEYQDEWLEFSISKNVEKPRVCQKFSPYTRKASGARKSAKSLSMARGAEADVEVNGSIEYVLSGSVE